MLAKVVRRCTASAPPVFWVETDTSEIDADKLQGVDQDSCAGSNEGSIFSGAYGIYDASTHIERRDTCLERRRLRERRLEGLKPKLI